MPGNGAKATCFLEPARLTGNFCRRRDKTGMNVNAAAGKPPGRLAQV
jgi:hypothetical protein